MIMKRIRYFLMFVLLAIVSVLIMVLPSENLLIQLNDIHELDLEWTIEFEDGQTDTIHLPQSYNGKTNEVYVYTATIPEHLRNGISMRIRSSMQEIQVYIDNQIVFDNTYLENEGPLFAPVASLWYFIDLSGCDDGCDIKIVNSSPVSTMSGMLNTIYYGDEGDLKAEILAANAWNVLFAVIVLVVSFVGFLADIFLNSTDSKRLVYLNIFFFSISVWILSELNVLQFIISSRFIIGSISYLMIPVMFTSFIQFLKIVSLDRYRKPLDWISVGFILYLIYDLISTIFFNFHHFENMFYLIVYASITLFILLVLLIYDAFIIHNKESLRYLLAISVLLLATTVTVLRFLLNDVNNMADGMIFGLAVFVAYLVYDTLIYIKRMLRLEGEAHYLKNIAYKDVLTGGLNRTKYEEDIDNHLNSFEKPHFRLVFLDINNLKMINDQLGHDIGDFVINEFYKQMTISFEGVEGSYCYRIGGDEFAIIMDNTQESIYNDCLNDFVSQLKDVSSNHEYDIEGAIASDVFDFTTSFAEFKRSVDLKMYEHKQQTKTFNYR